MIVNFKKQPLIEAERTRELLHQLPGALKELGEDWRDLFGISLKMATPGETKENKRRQDNECGADGVGVFLQVCAGSPRLVTIHLREGNYQNKLFLIAVDPVSSLPRGAARMLKLSRSQLV